MNETRVALLGLVAALLVVSVLLVLPFLEFVLLAVLLAYPLQPLQSRLETYIDARIAAGVLVLGASLVIVLPMLFVLRSMVDQATDVLDQFRSGDFSLDAAEAEIRDQTGVDVNLVEQLRGAAQNAEVSTFDSVLSLFGTVTRVLIGLALTVFLLYYFLKDGEKFGHWLRLTIPLPDGILDDLKNEFDDVMQAVLISHVFIAIVQGIVAGLGLVVLGIPNAIFWTAVMIILAVLPIIGSFLVWGPAVLYLFSIGQSLAAAGLFVYGTIVVGLTDDFLRPLVIEHYTENRLNPAVIILGILGGVYLFGFIGIFFGPVLIGLLRAVLDVYRREFVTDETVDGS
jgi:predicted PurR-regulated permease PerM